MKVLIHLCRIDLNMVIKVADFGLAVNTGAKEYYWLTKHDDVKLPLMWMAPESLSDYMFSEMSDIVNINPANYSFYPLLYIVIQYYTVELWSDMLGDIHRRPSSLHWC